MADKKPAPAPVSDRDLTGWLLGLIFVVIIIGALFARFEHLLSPDRRVSIQTVTTDIRESVTGALHLDSLVYTRNGLDVFDQIGNRGRVIGTQIADARGRIIGGPEELNDTLWWLVDFENPPDGWVDGDMVLPYGNVVSRTVASTMRILRWLAGILTVLFLVGIIYTQRGLGRLRKKQKEYLKRIDKELVDARPSNVQWEHVLSLGASINPGDWRIAIIEADILLDELVTSMGYQGLSLGDKLKTIELSDFVTLDQAWEAHKVRNHIAHRGSDFILTQRETARVIDLYRQVFEEFRYI